MAELSYEWGPDAAIGNLEQLGANTYPGRGIVLGRSTDGEAAVQVYWIMGRSEGSRNRIFGENGESIRTEVFDGNKETGNPDLTLYNAMSPVRKGVHVVSNGRQTDEIVRAMRQHKGEGDMGAHTAFVESLDDWGFEDDEPNYTPRISGFTTTETYGMSSISRHPLTGEPVHVFGRGDLGDIPTGHGLAVHTYKGDGKPLPAFTDHPFPVPVLGSAQETAEMFWEKGLNPDNRVAIAARFITLRTGEVDQAIINGHVQAS